MRFTKKVSVGYNPAPQKYGSRAIYNKLGQLEDIEDELGIDLITLFKARKGFYAYDFHEDYDGIIYFTEDLWANIFEGELGGSKIVEKKDNVVYVAHARYEFKDYGKTWALTKEELEK